MQEKSSTPHLSSHPRTDKIWFQEMWNAYLPIYVGSTKGTGQLPTQEFRINAETKENLRPWNFLANNSIPLYFVKQLFYSPHDWFM